MFRRTKNQEVNYDSVIEGLQSIYKEKLLPLEREYQFHDFHSPSLRSGSFNKTPFKTPFKIPSNAPFSVQTGEG